MLIEMPRHLHVLPTVKPLNSPYHWVGVRVMPVDRQNGGAWAEGKKEESFGHGLTAQDDLPRLEEEIRRAAEEIFRANWGNPSYGKMDVAYQNPFLKPWGKNGSDITILPAMGRIRGDITTKMLTDTHNPFFEYKRGEKINGTRDPIVFMPIKSIGIAKSDTPERGPDASHYVIMEDIHAKWLDGSMVNLKGLPCQNSVFSIIADAYYTKITDEEMKALRKGLNPKLRATGAPTP